MNFDIVGLLICSFYDKTNIVILTCTTDKAHALIHPDTHVWHFYPYHRYKMLAACIVRLVAPTGRPS